MKLTICLLTKGRSIFLNDALSSYEKFIDSRNVDVILIDNGADPISTRILLDWKLKHDQEVSYIRNDINDARGFTAFWEKLKPFNLDWILNPGDDDILVYDAYEEFMSETEKKPLLNAFASSAQIIDFSGRVTGEIRTPPIIKVSDPIEMLAYSMNQPPFFWPSLFFKYSAITAPVIHSRFVHDWWVGLQLVLSGQVSSSRSIGVKYRVHEGQESFQGSTRRKFFEGYNMLTSFISSSEFNKILESFSDLERENLMKFCTDYKPLYSQQNYYLPIIKELTLNCIKYSTKSEIVKSFSEKYAISAGIYTKKNDLNGLYTGFDVNFDNSLGNLKLSFVVGVCENILSVKDFFNDSAEKTILIACKHSKFYEKSIFINCDRLNQQFKSESADYILMSITSSLENSGDFNFIITPSEQAIIKLTRRFKLRIPFFIRKVLKLILER
jgi:hypothetical protein